MQTRSDDLVILLAVIDCGGFSSAAENLDMQVSRVSRAVGRVESQLGVTILNRTTRKVQLTDEGRQFVESIRIGLQSLQQAEDELVSRGELPKGTLRIDASSPFVFHQLVPLAKPFQDAFPHITLEISSNEGFVDLLEHRTDVAIRHGNLTDSTLHARPLGYSALFLVASPDYLSRRGVPKTADELLRHDTIGFSGAKILNRWPLTGFEPPQPKLLAGNGETVRQLALRGNGIACLSGFMVKSDIAEGRLISLLESNTVTNTGREQISAVYYRSSAVSKRISAFLDFIQPRLSL